MMVTGILAEKGFHAFDAEPKTHTGLKVSHIWFVVADSRQAYIYRRAAGAALVLIAHAQAEGEQIKSVDDHIFSPQSLDSRTRTTAQRDEPHALDLAFIRRLVEWLDVAEKEKAFDALVLVAAPYTLGNIRAGLPKNIQSRVFAEINKELTGLPMHEIQERLSDIKGSS